MTEERVHVTTRPTDPGAVTYCGIHAGPGRRLLLITIAGQLEENQQLCRRCAAAIRPEYVAEICKRTPTDHPDVEETLP